MSSQSLPLELPRTSEAPASRPAQERRLPSGRLIVVTAAAGREELEVRSADGQVEVHIVLTDAGPVVRLSAIRLELEATDEVALSCRRFSVHSSEATTLASDGAVKITGQEMRVKTLGDIHMDGDYIRLNCEDVQQPAR